MASMYLILRTVIFYCKVGIFEFNRFRSSDNIGEDLIPFRI